MLVSRFALVITVAGMFLLAVSPRPIAFQNALRYRALDMLYKYGLIAELKAITVLESHKMA